MRSFILTLEFKSHSSFSLPFPAPKSPADHELKNYTESQMVSSAIGKHKTHDELLGNHETSKKCESNQSKYQRKISTISQILHQSTHSEEKLFQCIECRKSFSHIDDLTVHQRTHTEDKPFKCMECGKSFRRNYALTLHQRTHTGEKPFKCIECGKCFSRNDKLILHQRRHTRVNSLECTECGNSFSQIWKLPEHQRTHTGAKAVQCMGCGKSWNVTGHGGEGDAQLKIAAAELAWAYHTNEHTSSYSSLDCSVKLSRVTFSDSEVATQMSCGQTKGEMLITDVLAPYSVELILSDLTSDHSFYSISSDILNHGNKKMFPLAVRYFDLKKGVSDRLLDFYEDFNETTENIKQKIVDTLSKYNLDFAHLSAYSADSANVNFDKFHSVYQLLTKENEKILPAKCPAQLVHNTAKKGCDLLSCDIEAFIGKVFGYFSVSSKQAEELKEIFDFIEMEGESLLRHVPTKCLSLLPAIDKMLKCWPAVKSYFQSVGKEECPSLIWKYIEDENGEKDYSKTEIYMLFLQNCLMIFEDAIRSLEKEELTAPELFNVMCRLRQKLIHRKNDSFFGYKTASELKKMSPKRGSQVKQDFLKFLTKALTYLESNFDFTSANYLCALVPFSLTSRGLTYDDIQCASECLKMRDILDMGSLHDEFVNAKDLIDKQVVYQNKPVDAKWMDIFGEMETKSYKYKNLLLLVSRILSIPCSNTFVERIFSLMSSHCTDTRNQCNVDLMRAELQVKVNFTIDSIQFYHYIKEKKAVLKAAGNSEKYDWKKKEKD